jgi:uroporphyrinogen-III decarboxylase
MSEMTSKERVMTTIEHREPDRVPLFVHSIDPKFIEAFGDGDVLKACEFLQVDCFPIRITNWCQGQPTMGSLAREIPNEEQTGGGVFAAWNGIDEFGRMWKRGSYVGGAFRTWDDINKYLPPPKLEERSPSEAMKRNKELYPDKAFSLNFHSGPFGLTMESMGVEHFCYSLYDDRDLIKEVIERRTSWFIEICQHVERLGADFVVLGDDVAYKGKTFVSPQDFKELAIPFYKRIVDSLEMPVFWHSDGFIEPLLDLAVEAGIKGIHAMEPEAGNDLGRIKEKYGDRFVLIGNVSATEVLTQSDLSLVRKDVDRCMRQAKKGGGYIISESNSLHAGCTFEAVKEMYRYAIEVGAY